ncbi:hypothetical protein LMG29542_05748 [Paraburkholderia humisilvae]|uniref:Uncharacterized protein n=1 Tax=Paraburkholderia humisilvae TaxID=627669 RepID=A0A6J5EQ40_9BURK|nr:hypothetical protein LMG29542_05748 [Paraburkholderia humisilvae]
MRGQPWVRETLCLRSSQRAAQRRGKPYAGMPTLGELLEW